MAGAFPDAPGLRMAYDRDATVVVTHDGSAAPVELTESQMQKLNDEAITGDMELPVGSNYLAFVFPQLRDLVAIGARFGDAGTHDIQTSIDTSNGLDGAWVNIAVAVDNLFFNPVGAASRSTWSSRVAPGVKAVRFLVSGLVADRVAYGVHLYGSITSGQTPDRLILTDSLDNPIGGAFFDWGDVPRGSSADKQFKVKNISTTKTATNTVVSLDALTDTVPSVAAQHYLSLDGVLFEAEITIPSLAPGESVLVTLRRVTPSTATLAVWNARLIAAPGVYA